MSEVDWSKWFDPEFSGSVYSAIIASSAAIYLGISTYKKQKQEDRKQSLLTERRGIYLDYLNASAVCYWGAIAREKDDFLNNRENYFSARDCVRLVSPRKIVDLVDQHSLKLLEIMVPEYSILMGDSDSDNVEHYKKIGDAYTPERDAMAEVVACMRKDLISHSTYQPEFPELEKFDRIGNKK